MTKEDKKPCPKGAIYDSQCRDCRKLNEEVEDKKEPWMKERWIEKLAMDTDIWDGLALFFHSENYEGDLREYVLKQLGEFTSKVAEETEKRKIEEIKDLALNLSQEIYTTSAKSYLAINTDDFIKALLPKAEEAQTLPANLTN